MINGRRIDRIEFDEVARLDSTALRAEPEEGERRELIAVRSDGSTYSLAFPADWDLGSALPPGHTVGFDSTS